MLLSFIRKISHTRIHGAYSLTYVNIHLIIMEFFPLILIIYYYGNIKVMLGTSLCNIIKFYIGIL